ncbi:hypothetical protein D8674_017667 [Pyrus ussuriensis x Pyrus communis]|uniref:RNase H type-1 domain-containing protein n=1 Tax=Pyrus ussuriensis x Pyrus communis TaxID=2448454 RepID=A0A5N5HGI6_9ROSA|nr:hypothetical protein D8674_017667 [Pyrus ussuriensis x Pyrus communis]
MFGPSDRRLDLNVVEEVAMSPQDNIWCPSFLSPIGPLNIGDFVMKNDMTAAVVANNFSLPKTTDYFPNGPMSWLLRILWLSVFNVRVLCLVWPNAYLLEPANYATTMKRKLDQLQESEGQILNDHQRFVSLFEMHLLPSSSGAIPCIEAPNAQPSVPPLSWVLPSTEAPNDQPPVPSIFEALPSVETSPEQPLSKSLSSRDPSEYQGEVAYGRSPPSLRLRELMKEVMAKYDDRLREVEWYKAKFKENNQLVNDARKTSKALAEAIRLKDQQFESSKRRNGENVRLKKQLEGTGKQWETTILEVSKVKGELDSALVEVSDLKRSILTERDAALQEYLGSQAFHNAFIPHCIRLDMRSFVRRDFRKYWRGLCIRFRDNDRQEDLMQEYVFVLLRIWKSRNDMIFNGVLANPMEMVHVIRKQILEFRVAQGYGWVLRDFAGMLIAAGGVGGLLFSSAAMAEAAAIRAAVQICIEMGCQNVGVESDSLMLIRMINKEYAIDATLKRFIYDIGLLVTQLRRVRLMFVKRNGNAAAHTFASYVASHGGAFRWDVLGPEFLFNILAEDVNVSIRI